MTNDLVPVKDVAHDKVVVVAFKNSTFYESLVRCRKLQRRKWNVGRGVWTEKMKEDLNAAYFSMVAVKERVSPLMQGRYASLLQELERVMPERFLNVVTLNVSIPTYYLYELLPNGGKRLAGKSQNANYSGRRVRKGLNISGRPAHDTSEKKFKTEVRHEVTELKVYFVSDAGVVWLKHACEQDAPPVVKNGEDPENGADVFLKENWDKYTLYGFSTILDLPMTVIQYRAQRMGLPAKKAGRPKRRESEDVGRERRQRLYGGLQDVTEFLDEIRQARTTGVSLKEYVDDLYEKIRTEIAEGKLKDDGKSYQVEQQPYEWAVDRRRQIEKRGER